MAGWEGSGWTGTGLDPGGGVGGGGAGRFDGTGAGAAGEGGGMVAAAGSAATALAAPVVSLSLGDTAIFRIGGTKRADATCSVKLASGALAPLTMATRY